jgi:hypothetical protein
MKKIFTIIAVICLSLITAGAATAVTYKQPTITVAWDAASIANLPTTATISYDYGSKLSPATVPTVIGNVATTSATFNFTTYGTYAMCARTVLKDSGVVQDTSPWACSDVTANVKGGVVFVNSFWPTLPTLSNLLYVGP